MYTESNNEADNNKLPPWKRILYIAVFLLLVFASILIYFYFNSFNKKVSIKQEGYIFWEDADIEPKICDFKIEGRFERYLFSNKRNTLVGKLYINDELVINGAWTFFNGYALLHGMDDSVGVGEEYDGFILNIDIYATGRDEQLRNKKNKCLIITLTNNIEGTLSKWQRYDLNPDREYMEPWQLDLLNNPNKILNRIDD